MAFGTITFTDPVFNKDYSRSLTPPDNPIEYTKKTPSPGNVFIYNTQTGARSEISVAALGPYFGFSVDNYGNPISTPIVAPALSMNYYTVVENEKTRNSGYSIFTLTQSFNTAGFYTSPIRPHTGSINLNEFDVPYLTPNELTLIQNAEKDYVSIGANWVPPVQTVTELAKPSSVLDAGPPGPPDSTNTQTVVTPRTTETVVIPDKTTVGSVWSMNIMGIPLVYVGGGLIGLLFLLRR